MRLLIPIRVALIVLPFLGAHAAGAQSAALPPAGRQPPDECKGSTLTGLAFMEMIHAIVAHGNLTDVQFIEKTLDTKFVVTHGWKEDGTHDMQTLYYESNRIHKNPIHVSIQVWSAYHQLHAQDQNVIAKIGFSSSDADNDFIGTCLHVSTTDLYAFFGKNTFTSFPAPPPVGVLLPPPPPGESRETQLNNMMKLPEFKPITIARETQEVASVGWVSEALPIAFSHPATSRWVTLRSPILRSVRLSGSPRPKINDRLEAHRCLPGRGWAGAQIEASYR